MGVPEGPQERFFDVGGIKNSSAGPLPALKVPPQPKAPSPRKKRVGRGRRAPRKGLDFSAQGARFLPPSPACRLPCTAMRRILETEDYVPIPPVMYADPFYRITYLMKEEIRKYKWIEGEKGRPLSWAQARQEWTDAHRARFEKFLMDTLAIPAEPLGEKPPAEPEDEPRALAAAAAKLSRLPRTGG
jgi:hypothetical protein